LSNKRVLLINKGVLVCILSSRSITVYNLRVKYTLAYKINPKATLVYSLDLLKWVDYKTSDSIEFKGVKGSTFLNLFLDLLLALFN
jgi:hypothetical protein